MLFRGRLLPEPGCGSRRREGTKLDQNLRSSLSARKLCVKQSARASGFGFPGDGDRAKEIMRSIAGLSALPWHHPSGAGNLPDA